MMGCGWGYGNYRSEKQREGPVLIVLCDHLLVVLNLFGSSGVFWGGIRYSLHVFLMR